MIFPYTPPKPGSNNPWYPVNGGQQACLSSQAQIRMFGGQSGGGKTDLLVYDPLQEVRNPNLRGLIIRKSYSEMQQIRDRMDVLYPQYSGRWKGDLNEYWFPTDTLQYSKIRLGYMSDDRTITKYQGNPFTCLGIDESTFLPESQVRGIIPWLASTDEHIMCRATLATNPGQIGAGWHKHVFLRGHCPVHEPDESVIPGFVYSGATWPSDGDPVNKTVAFFPSNVSENPLYGQDKLDSLNTLNADDKERFLRGCWCQLTGMYYSFLRRNYVIDLADAEEKWWWNHLIALDFGFGKSAAAACLLGITDPLPLWPQGRIYELGGLIHKRMEASEFAHAVLESFILPAIEGQRRRIVAIFLDPSNFKHIGTGPSVAQQIQAVFEPYDLTVTPASNDRIAGWQMLYRLLKSKQLVPTKCYKGKSSIYESLSTRMYSEKVSGDIEKVKGDELDDVADCIRYAMLSWFQGAQKPTEEKNRETLERYRKAGLDEHSLAMYNMKLAMEAQKQEVDDSPRLSRGRGRIIRR